MDNGSGFNKNKTERNENKMDILNNENPFGPSREFPSRDHVIRNKTQRPDG